jgi:hypothetical protein
MISRIHGSVGLPKVSVQRSTPLTPMILSFIVFLPPLYEFDSRPPPTPPAGVDRISSK